MSSFWERKKAELEETGQIAKPHVALTSHDGPWWQEGRQTPTQQPNAPTAPSQVHTRPSDGNCPHCRSENYSKPSPSIAARCFDCGYTAGRQLNELNLPGIASPDAATVKVKQIQQGGHFGRSVEEINANNAALEQSAQGRSKLA